MSDILENAKTNVCDMVLCYHRKIKQLILGRYCSYLHVRHRRLSVVDQRDGYRRTAYDVSKIKGSKFSLGGTEFIGLNVENERNPATF